MPSGTAGVKHLAATSILHVKAMPCARPCEKNAAVVVHCVPLCDIQQRTLDLFKVGDSFLPGAKR